MNLISFEDFLRCDKLFQVLVYHLYPHFIFLFDIFQQVIVKRYLINLFFSLAHIDSELFQLFQIHV